MKKNIYILMGLCLIFVAGSISAEDIAYVVKNSPDNFLTNELNQLNLTYNVILEKDVLSTNFSEYEMLLVGNDKFENPNDIPVSEHKSLIVNSYHYYKKGILFPNPQWGWSAKKGTQTSPSSIKINDFDISITSDISEIFRAYTINDPNIQTDYLSAKKPTGIRLLASVHGSTHTNADSALAIVYSGTEFLNGNIAQGRSLFFGITEPKFWTQESKKLFRNSVMWVLIGEDRDEDGFFTDIDCNDSDSEINPNATEIPYDGIDQNCDGSDLTDVDEDGYDSKIVGGNDCNDNDLETNPGSSNLSKNCVNDAPIIGTIPSLIYHETSLVSIFVSANDPENDSLTYSINDSRFNTSENVFTWQTDYEDAGNYVFTIDVNDGNLTTSGEVFLEIKEKNRAPSFNPIPNLEWNEDTNITLNLNDYFFDEDLDSLTFFVANTSNDTQITLESVTNGTANFTVEQDWNGNDWIIFRASDGKDFTDSNQINLTVLPVNDAPVLKTQIPDLEWDEDTPTTIDLSNYFKDIDSNLTYSSSRNLMVDINISENIATLVPSENWNGNDFVIFNASDGEFDIESNNVTLRVLPVNDAPVLENIEDITVLSGKLVEIIPSANSVDNDTLTFSFTSPLDSSGKWQTTENNIGNYKTTVTVSDGNNESDSQEVNIFVFQKILINEIFSNPQSGNEWIELYNPFSQNINLSNCVIKNSINNSIELNGVINENEYFIVELNNQLNNDGDMINLYCFDEVIDSVTYGNFDDGNLNDNAPTSDSGKSIGRKPNGEDTNNDFEDFRVFNDHTKELSNDADVTPPNVELLSPTNNEFFNDTRDIHFEFMVSDNIAEILECELYMNNILRNGNDAVNGSVNGFNVNNIEDGVYSWNVKCSDGINYVFAPQDRVFNISAPDNPVINPIENKIITKLKPQNLESSILFQLHYYLILLPPHLNFQLQNFRLTPHLII